MPAGDSANLKGEVWEILACVNTRLSEIGVHLMGGEELGRRS
jgi:hypothetical protein